MSNLKQFLSLVLVTLIAAACGPEYIVVTETVTTQVTCTTDDDCDKVEPGSICKASGICYQQVHTHTTEVVEVPVEKEVVVEVEVPVEVPGPTQYVCTDGTTVDDSTACLDPELPTCGTAMIVQNNLWETTAVNAVISTSSTEYPRIASYDRPTSGDNLLSGRIRASGAPGCQTATVEQVTITVYQSYDSDTFIDAQFEVHDQNGQIGTLLRPDSGYNNGSWVIEEYTWIGSLAIAPGAEAEFNLICTNCSTLPAHTTFNVTSNYSLKYHIGNEPDSTTVLVAAMDQFTYYGNPRNLEDPAPICTTITTPDAVHTEATSAVEVARSAGFTGGAAYPMYDQSVYEFYFMSHVGDSCNDPRINEVVFKLSSTRSLVDTYWKLKNIDTGEMINTTSFSGNELSPGVYDPNNGTIRFYLPSGITLAADHNAVQPRFRLLLNSSEFEMDDRLWVAYGNHVTWTDTTTGENYTAAVHHTPVTWSY